MEFEYSKKTKMYMEQLQDFMTKYIYPSEKVFHDQLDAASTRWQVPPIESHQYAHERRGRSMEGLRPLSRIGRREPGARSRRAPGPPGLARGPGQRGGDDRGTGFDGGWNDRLELEIDGLALAAQPSD